MTSALAAIAAVAVSAVSSSKLGVSVSNDDPSSILAACPRMAVFPLPSGNANIAAEMSAYKTGCAGARVIVQVGRKFLAIDANTEANQGPGWLTAVQATNTACSGCIDSVEGPTEPTELAAGVLPGFWTSFAQRMSGAGFQPIVGGLAPGLPLNGRTASDAFCATATAVRAQLGTSFAWSQHARSPSFSTDVTGVSGATFAYRQIALDCASALAGIPLFLTEAGPASAWQTSDGASLAPFDAQLAADAEVQGAALFEASTGTFSLAPVATALLTELATTPIDGGTPDGGTDGGGTGSGTTPGGPPIGGTLGTPKTSGCSTGGPALFILSALPVLFVIRRRR